MGKAQELFGERSWLTSQACGATEIAQLVKITPMLLWFIVLMTVVTGHFRILNWRHLP